MQKHKVYEFRWKAINKFQQSQRGCFLAETLEEVENKLLKKGYTNIRIQRNFVFSTKPSSESITQVINQLALLLNAAIPLKQSLCMVQENSGNVRLYLWLRELIGLIESGYSLSKGLDKLKLYLVKNEIQLINIGEKSGQLGVILANIAQSRSQAEKLHKKVKKIMFYPLMTLSISLILSIGMLLFIVPQFIELYSDKEKVLPLLTSILFSLSAFLQTYGLLIAFAFVVLGTMFIWFAKNSTFLTAFKWRMFSLLPVFNQIITNSRIVFFSQNLALMLKNHMRLEIALNAFLSAQTQDIQLKKEINMMLTFLRQGYKLSDCLNPTVFQSQVIQMIAVAERSGSLIQMLEHIGEIYQQKLDYQIDLLSQMIEPILMMMIGLVIGTILIGLYLPIFDMGGLAG
ncbi:type II secretion system F family protein [Actinobacillus arthritidis]|uniref:type II secretion system F family protein n=1 Tax=Actinobacillus arthritidis TaxID=157339 RepID=UPI002442A748|nr:type II secretion system F family protein [Actinobacillus arthritidis]WGE89835.1 type II secretion system F family protein [Actinobacillus arthritidis]